ncbi:JAB domain-containing protein [Aestuariivivens marinum]|uniref:JAB domain-containing protein n=1 Tax=Aestuariivivens marinum TaxID=2913555 RepID=UPI001F562520|nr:JAB domain-containing protein [Aestuariivivens marinum]
MNTNLKVTSSKKAFEVILSSWNNNTIELLEEFKVLLLNNSNIPLGLYTLSKGGMTATLVDIRVLFSVALKSCATAMITVHNHPSGKLHPSNPDIEIYKKIKEVAKFHDINYLDNLIITPQGYYSFMDEGI